MFACVSPRRPRRLRNLLQLVGLVAIVSATGVLRAAEPSQSQRDAFKQAYSAARQGDDHWRSLASALRDYPLYPYLPAAELEHNIQKIDSASVQAYLEKYQGMIPAADLRRDFLIELARRKDWNGFLAMYQPGLGVSLSCDALQAHMAAGQPLDFDQDLATLWSRPSLPGACDPVLTAAHDQGLLTPARLWTRIDLAADAGKGGTVASLAPWLPGEDARVAEQLALALRDPSAALAQAAAWTDTVRHRQAVTIALTLLAQHQSDAASQAWHNVESRFQFSTEQRDQILHAIALFYATDFDDKAIARLLALPPAAQSDSTREWRVRVALARQDWPEVLAGIDAMPSTQQHDEEWRYFRARALAATGQQSQARQRFAALAEQANFFGFLAADQLHQPYAICPLQLAEDTQREEALLSQPGLLRAFELHAVGLPHFARREWNLAMRDANQDTQRLAADLANRRGWYDRAIFTFSSGDALRIYRLRFPLVPQDDLAAQAEQAGIEPAWAYGILRAESAWVTDAHSGADARGLMQLLPATAARVASNSGLGWNGAASLYDPAVNIALGTRYLAQVASRFNGSPWLASAAYNAGPNRVDQWVATRGTLAPDVFVATIPFKETREYVERVMAFSVIYDWRLHDNVVPLSYRMGAIDQPYLLPGPGTSRRAVDCPAVDAQTPATPSGDTATISH